MRGELRVFTKSHKPIGVIYPAADIAASWQRNELGALTFRIPKRSLRWSTTYVRHLNRIEYHHPQLPVVWVGVIVAHAPAGADVVITCVSGEWLYYKRFTEFDQEAGPYIAVVTAAEHVVYLHEQADRRGFLGITPGDVQLGGDTYELEFELANVGESLKALAELAGADVWVEKRGHAHSDLWTLRWSRARGRDLRGQMLLCSEVVDSPSYPTSANDMATQVHVLGHEEGPFRLYVQRTDRPAERVYGHLEAKHEADIADVALAEQAGEQELGRVSQPVGSPALNIDNRRGVFGTFWVGDVVRAMIPGLGYAGLDRAVSIEGIQFNEQTETMGLIVREAA